jgi:bifunctional non-homologous end joining protein LigD
LEKSRARFFKPMECLPVQKIPEGKLWTYELKLDGYRLQGVKAAGKIRLYSQRGIDLTKRHLRHAKFVGLHEDKEPRKVTRET